MYYTAVMSVPIMSSQPLLNIMGALEEYVVDEMKFFNQSEFFNVQKELLDSGLEMHEAESVLMHTSKISTFISEMNDDLEIFKKVAKFREDRAKKTNLIETKKKELEEAHALVATKLAELEEAHALVATKLAELEKLGGP